MLEEARQVPRISWLLAACILGGSRRPMDGQTAEGETAPHVHRSIVI